MSKIVNIGIIGAGRIGQIHGENLCTGIKQVRVVAVADKEETRTQVAAGKYGKVK